MFCSVPIVVLGVLGLAYNIGLTFCQVVRGTAKKQSHLFVVPTVACGLVAVLFPPLWPWALLAVLLDPATYILAGLLFVRKPT